MNREQKTAQIDNLHARISATSFVILTDFKGATVAQMDAVRRSCESNGIFFQVVKNTLAVRALGGTGKEVLTDDFVGNVGLVISGDDPVATAKLFRQHAKDNDKIILKGGFFDGGRIDGKAVALVADLPSKEELHSKLLATIIRGPQLLLGVLQAPARDLLYLLQNYATKLEDGQK